MSETENKVSFMLILHFNFLKMAKIDILGVLIDMRKKTIMAALIAICMFGMIACGQKGIDVETGKEINTNEEIEITQVIENEEPTEETSEKTSEKNMEIAKSADINKALELKNAAEVAVNDYLTTIDCINEGIIVLDTEDNSFIYAEDSLADKEAFLELFWTCLGEDSFKSKVYDNEYFIVCIKCDKNEFMSYSVGYKYRLGDEALDGWEVPNEFREEAGIVYNEKNVPKEVE